MRDIPPELGSEIVKQQGGEFRWLVHIVGTTTQYYCSDARTISGQAYIAELIEIGIVREEYGEISDTTISIIDTSANRGVCQRGAVVLIWLIPASSTDISHADLFFSGEIAGPISIKAGRLRFDVVSSSRAALDRIIGDPISVSTFPGVDPAAVGSILPIYWGSHDRVPAVGIDAGSVTSLAANLTDSETSEMRVTSALLFPASGTVQIGDEQIAYTGNVGIALTGLTRGVNSTTAAAHNTGAMIAEIQTSYVYRLADHPITEISDIYIYDLRWIGVEAQLAVAVNATATTFTLNDASQFPNSGTAAVMLGLEWITWTGKTGNDLTGITRGVNNTTAQAHPINTPINGYPVQFDLTLATITFDVLPTIQRDIPGLLVNDTIDVTENIGVNSTTDTTRQVAQKYTATIPFILEGETTINKTFPDPGVSVVSQSITIDYAINLNNEVLVTGDRYVLEIRLTNPLSDWEQLYEYYYDGQTIWTTGSTGGSVTVNFGSDARTVQYRTSITGVINLARVRVTRQERVMNVPGIVNSEKTGDVAKIGTVRITSGTVAETRIGQVSADIIGWPDVSGDITGIVNAPIIRPDHIMRHLLLTYGNVLPAEAAESDFVAKPTEEMSVAVRSPTQLRDLRDRIDLQAVAMTSYSGARWRMTARPGTGAITPIATLTADHVLRTEDGVSSLELGQPSIEDIVTRIQWRALQDARGEWAASAVQEIGALQGTFGLREGQIDMPDIILPAMITAVLDRAVALAADVNRFTFDLSVALSQYRLEIGDIVRLTHGGVDIVGEIVAIEHIMSGELNGSRMLTIDQRPPQAT